MTRSFFLTLVTIYYCLNVCQSATISDLPQLDIAEDDRSRLMPKEDSGPVNVPSSSRARMLAQQRELQLKKRESATAAGGMIRSVDGADALRRSSENQFTPAVRQFSAPKAVKDSSAE